MCITCIKPQITAHSLGDGTRDCQADACAIYKGIQLYKLFKDVLRLVSRNANTCILDGKTDLTVCIGHTKRDAAFLRKFHRILQQLRKGSDGIRLSEARERVTAALSQVDVITKGQSARSGSVNVTDLRSTISGLVLSVPVKVGTSVSGTSAFTEGTTVAKIADMGDIIFDGYIDETEVAKLRIGMEMELTLGSMQDQTISATLEYIAPEGEMQNGARMFELKGTTRVPEGITIRSGYSANANIVLAKAEKVLACDETAVQFEGGKTYVYVLTSAPDDTEHQTFERREVTTGISDGLHIELKSGVQAGDILRGIQK